MHKAYRFVLKCRLLKCRPWKCKQRLAKPLAQALILSLFGFGLISQTAYAEIAKQSGGVTLHWPARVYVWRYNPANKPDWLDEAEALQLIQTAVAGWGACGITLRYDGLSNKVPGVMDADNVLGWKTDGKNYSAWTNWAVHRDGRAIEADVTLYTNIFNDYQTKGMDAKLELRKSIIHEFGHVLGLSHSAQVGDAMSVKRRTLPEWTLPSDNDIARCKQLYPPLE